MYLDQSIKLAELAVITFKEHQLMSKLRVGITTLVGMLASFSVLADTGLDEKINIAIKPYADAVTGFVFSSFPVAGVQIPFVLVWLIVAAIIFTFYFNFIKLGHSENIIPTRISSHLKGEICCRLNLIN